MDVFAQIIIYIIASTNMYKYNLYKHVLLSLYRLARGQTLNRESKDQEPEKIHEESEEDGRAQ